MKALLQAPLQEPLLSGADQKQHQSDLELQKLKKYTRNLPWDFEPILILT